MFTQKDLLQLKKLARIDLSPEEEQGLLGSIERVLSYVEQLQEVDTTGVEPCSYILKAMLKNKARADEVKDLLSRDLFLANASDAIGGMIRIPPLLKPPS